MPLKKGEVYQCPDDSCGCEVMVSKGRREISGCVGKIEDLKRIKNVLINLIESCKANAQTQACVCVRR